MTDVYMEGNFVHEGIFVTIIKKYVQYREHMPTFTAQWSVIY